MDWGRLSRGILASTPLWLLPLLLAAIDNPLRACGLTAMTVYLLPPLLTAKLVPEVLEAPVFFAATTVQTLAVAWFIGGLSWRQAARRGLALALVLAVASAVLLFESLIEAVLSGGL
jgi:hypothetical protein